ncbi:hypothetical protein GmRootV118_37890 [Variovorax sp. V118]
MWRAASRRYSRAVAALEARGAGPLPCALLAPLNWPGTEPVEPQPASHKAERTVAAQARRRGVSWRFVIIAGVIP